MKELEFIPQIIMRSPLFPFGKSEYNPAFAEAIYLTSPTLYCEYQKLLANTLTDKKDIQKLNISLYKYHSRASTRCTPFGLFAGLGVGSFGDESEARISSDLISALNRKTRPDMNVLCNLAQELAKQPYIKPYIVFYPNNSIYKIENYYRYIEYYYTNSRRIHKISKVDFSEYLELILTESKQGKTITELCGLLVNEHITEEEAINFIDELLAAQLLTSELEPTVTGTEFFEVIRKILLKVYKIHASDELNNLINRLDEIQEQITQLDKNILNNIEDYQNIFNRIKSIIPAVTEVNLLQTDLFKNYEKAYLHADIQQSLKKTLTFLNKISPPANTRFEKFINRFSERYGDSEIQLLQVLDTETGLGYADKDKNGLNNLVDDLFVYNGLTEENIKWNALQSALHKLITKSIEQKQTLLKISEADFEGIDFSDTGLPHSISIKFNVLNSTTNKIAFSSAGGSSAVNLLGRFAHGNKEVSDIVNTISRHEQEQAGNSILAEIVHLPESRVGNVLARPSFRQYEIPYLAKAAASGENQIDPADLYISVKNNKIILRSKRLNKQIIPRLGNAHNFSFNALPVYQFLGDLQIQYFSKPSVFFDFGALSRQYVFLPRVEYENVVLSPAKWQLQKVHFEALLKAKTEEESITLFSEFKQKHQIPDLFIIADGDNDLLIDTKQTIAILTFIDCLKNRQQIILEEFLFELENPLVKDTDNKGYTNECIAIILNEGNKLTDVILDKPNKQFSQKDFIIGSEWLYYKIYSGVKVADYILTEKLKIITENLLEQQYIDKWFFIRYADPENHLRFRLHLTDTKHCSYIISAIHKELETLLKDGLISKIQTDTYTRELKRYGDNSIELAESVFYHDSVCCANAISLLDAEEGNVIRWQFALRITDQLLDDFELELEKKYDLMCHLSQNFFMEHGGKKELKIQLDDKFRKLRKDIESVLDRSTDSSKDIYELIEIIEKRGEAYREVVQDIIRLQQSGNLKVNFTDLLCSFIHMMLNRIFLSKQRLNEFVIYDLLTKHYKSSLARTKQKTALNNVISSL